MSRSLTLTAEHIAALQYGDSLRLYSSKMCKNSDFDEFQRNPSSQVFIHEIFEPCCELQVHCVNPTIP
jgi:hypothetical protein